MYLSREREREREESHSKSSMHVWGRSGGMHVGERGGVGKIKDILARAVAYSGKLKLFLANH